MSDKQTKLLFAKLEELSKQIADMKAVVHRAAANSELVLSCYQEHGTAIELLERRMERIKLRCPLMKPDTSELEKVG